ncbi:hypothetical protein B0H14DRAFT_2597326 [Mycena olivaceomarginata]|nr:hypothetical protein B0H14DRAFT_2597326 [Mycena olivaceomarginata]
MCDAHNILNAPILHSGHGFCILVARFPVALELARGILRIVVNGSHPGKVDHFRQQRRYFASIRDLIFKEWVEPAVHPDGPSVFIPRGGPTGAGPGLDVGARRMEDGVVRFYTCVPRTVCTAGESEGFVGVDLFFWDTAVAQRSSLRAVYKGKTSGIGKNKKAMHLGFAARRRDCLGRGAHRDTVELSIYCGNTWRLIVKDVGGVIGAASTPGGEFELPRNGTRIKAKRNQLLMRGRAL